jgi:hypothetical protein
MVPLHWIDLLPLIVDCGRHHHLYNIPEAEALLPGVTADVMNRPYHQWTKGLSKEQLQQQLDFYKKKYNQ